MLAAGSCHPAPTPHLDCGIAPPGFAPASRYYARGIEPLTNTIHLDRAGAVSWNGVRLGEPEEDAAGLKTLDSYLASTAQLNPVPATTLMVDRGTPCARLAAVRALMERHLHCSTGAGCLQGPLPQ